jgi:hypothetical protein
MLHHSAEHIGGNERVRLERAMHPPLLNKVLSKAGERCAEIQGSVDVYDVSVLRCFIPPDFSEELPLYLLDLGGMILVLFGQWVFDPHTLIAQRDIFDAWNSNKSFFSNFSMRCHRSSGTVLQLTVGGSEFVEARRMPSAVRFKHLREYQLVTGNGATLITDLEKAGLIGG